MSDKKYIKLTKSYTRKVGLNAVSSEYENIERGTFVTSVVEFTNKEDLLKQSDELSKLVVNETEKDIRETIAMLLDMSDDSKNNALLGKGASKEDLNSLIEDIDGIEDYLKYAMPEVPSGPTLQLEEINSD